jgi:AraC family transcriptional activator of pobA
LQYFPLDAGADSFFELLDLKNKIIREVEQSDKAAKLSVVLLFQLFLLNLYRLRTANEEETVKSDDRILNHFTRFKKLIKQHGHEGKTVKFYAQEMRLTPVHLNRICKTVAQKTALQIIHEQLIIESRKYLSGTTNSIAEIAYFLGFKDPAHFSKFFKKKVGVSPGMFRREG